MTERAMPVFEDAEETLELSREGLDIKTAGEVAKAQVGAAEMMASWRPWLFPEDDRG